MRAKEEPILVAIHCLVYNHEPYLRDCLEGFVIQKTNFRYVAIVHEDCSTDDSAAIIQEYAEKYPNIIKPIFEKENLWSKHDGTLDKVMQEAIDATDAKYIAMCDGDDYWTDPLKLQKQVCFLETHPEYDMVCTRFKHLYHEKNQIEDFDLYNDMMPQDVEGLELTHEHFYQATIPHSCTVMYRVGTMEDDDLLPKLRYKYDYPAYYCFMRHHRVWLMNQKTAVYRKHIDSLTTRSNIGKFLTFYETYKDIYQYEKTDVIHYLLQYFTESVTSAYIRTAQELDMKQVMDLVRTYYSITPNMPKRFRYITKVMKSYIVRYTKGLKIREKSIKY